MADQTKIITVGILFVVIFLSGFWVSRSGKPYHAVIFNLHKLIALATGVYLLRTIYLSHQFTPLDPNQIKILGVMGIIFMVIVVAGGLLSVFAEGGLSQVSQSVQGGVLIVHKTFPYLGLVSTGLFIYGLLPTT